MMNVIQEVEDGHAVALQGEASLRAEAESRASLAEERAQGLQARLTAMEAEHSSMRGQLLTAKMTQAQLEERLREEEEAAAGLQAAAASQSGNSSSGSRGGEPLAAHVMLLRGVEEALHSAKSALR